MSSPAPAPAKSYPRSFTAQKATLGRHFKSKTTAMNRPSSMPLIVDGGWLLHQCNFESGESFENISLKIVRFTANLGTAGKKITVVFDGYGSSPKDHDHGRRSKSYSSNLLLHQQYTLYYDTGKVSCESA